MSVPKASLLIFNCYLTFSARFLLAKLHINSLVDKMIVRVIKTGIENLLHGLKQLLKAYDDSIDRIE
jgi:hypothetical protein